MGKIGALIIAVHNFLQEKYYVSNVSCLAGNTLVIRVTNDKLSASELHAHSSMLCFVLLVPPRYQGEPIKNFRDGFLGFTLLAVRGEPLYGQAAEDSFVEESFFKYVI